MSVFFIAEKSIFEFEIEFCKFVITIEVSGLVELLFKEFFLIENIK